MNYPQSGLKTTPASKRDSAFNQTWGWGGCDTNGEASLQDVSAPRTANGLEMSPDCCFAGEGSVFPTESDFIGGG